MAMPPRAAMLRPRRAGRLTAMRMRQGVLNARRRGARWLLTEALGNPNETRPEGGRGPLRLKERRGPLRLEAWRLAF